MIATRIVELHLLRWPGWLGRDEVWFRFLRALNGTAGIMVVSSIREGFPVELVGPSATGAPYPGGMSGVVIIAESHAAIHTWPERKLIWCELATCGDPAALGDFEANVRKEFAEFGENNHDEKLAEIPEPDWEFEPETIKEASFELRENWNALVRALKRLRELLRRRTFGEGGGA